MIKIIEITVKKFTTKKKNNVDDDCSNVNNETRKMEDYR